MCGGSFQKCLIPPQQLECSGYHCRVLLGAQSSDWTSVSREAGRCFGKGKEGWGRTKKPLLMAGKRVKFDGWIWSSTMVVAVMVSALRWDHFVPTAKTWLTRAGSANTSISKSRGASRRAGWGDSGEEKPKHTVNAGTARSVHQLSSWGQLFLRTVLNHTWVRFWWGVKCSDHRKRS